MEMRSGFTLIEVLVSVVVVALLSILFLETQWQMKTATERVVSENVLLENANFIIQKLSTDGKAASSIDRPLFPGDSSNHLILRVNDSETIEYFQFGDTLKRIRKSDGSSLSEDILTAKEVKLVSLFVDILSPNFQNEAFRASFLLAPRFAVSPAAIERAFTTTVSLVRSASPQPNPNPFPMPPPPPPPPPLEPPPAPPTCPIPGAKIAYTVSSSPSYPVPWDEIWLANASGSVRCKLISRRGAGSWMPAFKKGGGKIVFLGTTSVDEPDYGTRAWVSNIYEISENGSGLRRVRSRDGVYHSRPSYAPDGRILYGSNDGGRWRLYLYPDGTAVSPSTFEGLELQCFDGDFSPDGAKIVTSCSHGQTREIFEIRLSDLSVRRLTTFSLEGERRFPSYPSYAPDGSKIAFELSQEVTRPEGERWTSSILVMNADGSGQHIPGGKLAGSYPFHYCCPDWVEDGSALLYSKSQRNPAGIGMNVGIYRYQFSTEREERIINIGSYPNWKIP